MSSPMRGGERDSPAPRRRREDARRRPDGSNSPYRWQNDASSPLSMSDEFSRLYIDKGRAFHQQLDDQIADQAQRHEEALLAAAAEHDRVRKGAERAREREELEKDRERRRKEAEDVRHLEAERNAKAEEEALERRRQKEALQRQEEALKRRTAEEREIEATRLRLAEQKRKDEAEAALRKQEQEEADRKAKEARDAAVSSVQAPPPVSKPAPTPAPAPSAEPAVTSAYNPPDSQPNTLSEPPQPQSPPSHAPQSAARSSSGSAKGNSGVSLPEREALHGRYLQLHQELKKMRKYVIDDCKKNNMALKQQLGEMRRRITMVVGQITTNKTANQVPMREIQRVLLNAQTIREPSVNVASFIVSSPTDGSPIMQSGCYIYLLNIFAKCVINQLINEASLKPEIAEPIGIMTSTIFSLAPFRTGEGISLIDILLAKYHKACPVLWGIFGDEKTAKGRNRIGWRKTEDGEWVSEQDHVGRMSGLGAGYAALSLRDFSRAKNANPYPPANYWKSLSYIINTPGPETQPTHFLVLKGLLEGYIAKFVQFYGQAAVVALRKALVDFPTQAAKSPARDTVAVMRDAVRREFGLVL